MITREQFLVGARESDQRKSINLDCDNNHKGDHPNEITKGKGNAIFYIIKEIDFY